MNPPTYTTGQLAQLLSAELVGPADLALTSVAALEQAEPGALSFIRSSEFARHWRLSKAAAALVTRGVEVPGHDPATRAILYVDNADAALIQILNALAPDPDLPPVGVDPTAAVHETAEVDPSARIGPLCRVGPNAFVGPNAVMVSSVVIGRAARVGADTILHAGVVIQYECVVGRRCLFHPGVVIGADGFGFIQAPDKTHVKIPHLGNVTVGDDVELGANSCIDRAKLGSTIVGNGCKTDNLVHIGHNCVLGKNVIICGSTAVGGSVNIADNVMIGGMSAIADGSELGEGARLGGAAALIKNKIPAGETWWGNPAIPARDALSNHSAFRTLRSTLKGLQRDIDALKESVGQTPTPDA